MKPDSERLVLLRRLLSEPSELRFDNTQRLLWQRPALMKLGDAALTWIFGFESGALARAATRGGRNDGKAD